MTLASELALCLQLSSLACASIELQLKLVDSCVEILKLLSAQELFLFIWEATKAIDLLSLNLTELLLSLALSK